MCDETSRYYAAARSQKPKVAPRDRLPSGYVAVEVAEQVHGKHGRYTQLRLGLRQV